MISPLLSLCHKVAQVLYRQEGCHPYKVAFFPWAQLPLWFVLSFTLRNMTGFLPGLSPREGILTGLAPEGMLWFPDLTTPDPYYILPIMLAAANMTNIEVRCYVTCYCCNSETIAPLHVYTPGVLLFCSLPVCKLYIKVKKGILTFSYR